MKFNNIINHLLNWCDKKSESCRDSNKSYGGVYSALSMVLWELNFKLSSLIDKEFETTESFRNSVFELIDIHYDNSIIEPQNGTVTRMIEKLNDEFRFCLTDLLFDADTLSFADRQYYRVILGNEAEGIIKRFKTVWSYENTSYWFPLMGEEPRRIEEKFYVMFDYIEPHINEISKLIGLPDAHIYEYSERDIFPDHCIETTEIPEYGGHETIYTDKNFSWAIYFSHEDTVAFAGSIVSKVKEILAKEKDHFNKFEWDLD